jgi:branched-chain amino acid transport system ATP-binding protein
MLAVKSLSAWYGAARVLYDLTFEVGRGEVVALLGRNGAGKSSTMKAIIGLIDRRKGVVQFNGEDISSLQPFEIARRGIGFTPENRRIFTDLSVMENLDVGRQPPRNFTDGAPAPFWTPERLFTLFPNLGDMRSRLGSNMSGGEQKMLAIARTLMSNPLLILLDEPSEGIAPVIMEKMVDIIFELKNKGISILLGEQNLPLAEAISDRAYVLESGRLRWQGPMVELIRERALQKLFLGV